METLQIADVQNLPMVQNIVKVLFTGFLGFGLALFLTPWWTDFLYRNKIGIKIKSSDVNGEKLSFVSELHKVKAGTPTMGGVLLWVPVLILAFLSHFLFPYVAEWFDVNFIARLDFLKRSQVWLPLFTLAMAGFLGMVDDWQSVRGVGSNKGGGMRFLYRFWWLLLIASAGAWWFYAKLGWDILHIPAMGDFAIGMWYVPLFIFVILYTAVSSNETDGLDGLNAGVLTMAFSVFSVIAFMQNKVDLAAFCAVLVGCLLSFLWFNIYPARFFMGDTGAVALGTTLGVVAMLTNSIPVLFIVTLIYLFESGSVVIQLTSKKFFKRKVFLAAPIHHHFEALGWPEPKIVMRAWVITALCALLGLMVGILGMGK